MLCSSCLTLLFCSRKAELLLNKEGIDMSIPASNPEVNTRTNIQASEPL